MNKNDTERLEKLFELYTQMSTREAGANPKVARKGAKRPSPQPFSPRRHRGEGSQNLEEAQAFASLSVSPLPGSSGERGRG